MTTTLCPNPRCKLRHKGHRDAELLHREASRVVTRAAEMPLAEALQHMRIGFLALGLELSGFCCNCVLEAHGNVAGMVFDAHVTVQAAEEAMQAATRTPEEEQAIQDAYVERHVCRVIPFRRTQ